MPNVLWYGTGGLAYGRVRSSGATAVIGTSCDTIEITIGPPVVLPVGCTALANNASSFSDTQTKLGWTLGAGFEGVLAANSNWSWKVEYLYVDLGTVTNRVTASNNAVITYSNRITDNILRVGFNYRFSPQGFGL
jgi:outer membrane immunogenic protein